MSTPPQPPSPPPGGEPHGTPMQWPAADLSAAIGARRVSCREVMADCLARIDAINPALNAIVSLRERDALLAEAGARDAELAGGHRRGWMHGLPHAVKDAAATAGLRTTMGSPLLAGVVPPRDAFFVERLRAAGAIVIGKTNVPEFGLGSHTFNPVFGTTRNPYDPGRSAGGSSGGAAAALAARLVPVADGSDMMGSLRNPAAFCNVYGFRPSFGRVPAGPGNEPYLQQLVTDGPMARSVQDLAWLLSIMAGREARAPLSLPGDGAAFSRFAAEAAARCGDGDPRSVRGVRIGWLGDWGGHLPMEDGVLALCREALAVFERDLGCTVVELAPPFDGERLWDCWVTLRAVLVAGRLHALHRDPARRALLKPEAQWEVERGLRTSALDFQHASEVRAAWHAAACDAFTQVDVLALPAAQVFPFDAALRWPAQVAGRQMDTYHRWMEAVVPASLLGAPAVSVPAGFGGATGLPMGLQLIGAPLQDLAVLRLAHAYDVATGWPARRPPPLAAP